jgi:Rrf2 family iron-sulfur cluster assembly transcriptional regulator
MRSLPGLDRRLQLAVAAVLDIALHGGREPVQSKDTAARLGLPRRHLEQLMQQLVRAGLLKGVRGPRGGYRLARERRRISLADLLLALQGERAAAEADEPVPPLVADVLAPLWAELEALLVERLAAVSLESLCERAAAAGRAPPQPDVDFVI